MFYISFINVPLITVGAILIGYQYNWLIGFGVFLVGFGCRQNQ